MWIFIQKQKIFFIRWLILIVSFFALIVLILLKDGFQNLTSDPYQQTTQLFYNWDQVFKNPTDVVVTTLVTGTAEGDRFVVLDKTDPNIKNIKNRYEPSVIMSHWLRHPVKGDFLIDAGLSKTFSTGTGNYNYLLNLIFYLLDAKSKQSAHMDSVSQLAVSNVTPKAIFLTHLHADHTSGVADFETSTDVVFGKNELTFIQKAMMGKHLSGKKLFSIDFDNAASMPPFDKAVDLFGDGSFWAISTAGHSPDHISYLVNEKSGAKLIIGDAAAYYAQLKHKIRPTSGVYNVELAIEHLSQLNTFLNRYPNVKMLVGHELVIQKR